MSFVNTTVTGCNTSNIIITWNLRPPPEAPPPSSVREPRRPLPSGPPVLAAVRAPDGTWEVRR